MSKSGLSDVVSYLRTRADSLRAELALVEGHLQAVEAALAATGRPPAAAPKAAAKTPAPAVPAARPAGKAAKATVTRPAAAAAASSTANGAGPAAAPVEPADRRKGRRKASGPAAIDVSNLGIVEAAIALARARGVKEADAGEILSWFKQAGYRSGEGLPTRNSVYVSLNREVTDGSRRGRIQIDRPGRGRFAFHF
jgi:hypothetical protein